MNFQNHYDWLFSDPNGQQDRLTDDQRAELQAHLSQCVECQRLSIAWQAVAGELAAPEMAAPADGFSDRWRARLALARQRRHRTQSLYFLLASLAGAAAVILLWLALPWPALRSPELMFWSLIYNSMQWVSAAAVVQKFINGVLLQNRLISLLFVWILVVAFFSQLLLLWTVSVRVVIVNPRRIIK